MQRAFILYGSTTGNTEFVARHIADLLQKKGISVEIKDVARAHVKDLSSDTELVIMGCSTWGEDEIGLQEDFEPFHERLCRTDLSGDNFALFGCGDSGYKHFCGAVDLIEQTIKNRGGEIIHPSLKIDGEPEESLDQINQWLNELISKP